MTKPTFLLSCLLAFASLSAGCNRTPSPVAAASDRAFSAHVRPTADLATADRQGRVALSLGADQRLVFVMLGNFDAKGQALSGVDANAVVRYASPGTQKPALMSAYFDFQNQPTLFSGSIAYKTGVGLHLTLNGHYPAPAIAPLVPSKLPSPARAVAMALAAGLTGDAFLLQYSAEATGPEVVVGSWGLEDGNHMRVLDTRAFDCLTLAPIPQVSDDPLLDAGDDGASAAELSSFDLQLRLFAVLREHAGAGELTVVVPAGTTVGGLARLVRDAAPALGPYLGATRVAVNLAFAPDEQVLTPTDQVALIPPVGGG